MSCRRHRRRRVVRVNRRAIGSEAEVNNFARTGAQSAGIVNVNVQVPINFGDAQSFNRSRGNSVSNFL